VPDGGDGPYSLGRRPISLPPTFGGEALAIRNQAPSVRSGTSPSAPFCDLVDRAIEQRLNQSCALLHHRILLTRCRTRPRTPFTTTSLYRTGHETEAHVLEVIRDILASPEGHLSIKDILLFSDRNGEDYERKVTTSGSAGHPARLRRTSGPRRVRDPAG